jgi:hypothetical protein
VHPTTAATARRASTARAARRLLYAAAMSRFDSLWEPLVVTVLGLILFGASL